MKLATSFISSLFVCLSVFARTYTGASFVTDVKGAASGFFRVEQIDDGGVPRWWIVDPLGRGFVHIGIDHPIYRGFYRADLGVWPYHETNKKLFPNRHDWVTNTAERLKRWGFNAVGSGGDYKNDVPYLSDEGFVFSKGLWFGKRFCFENKGADYCICAPNEKTKRIFPNVFHSDFAAWCDKIAKDRCVSTKDDPYLFGYWLDNEIRWCGWSRKDLGLFDAVASLDEKHSARIALANFLAKRGVVGAASERDKEDFVALIAEKYFETTTAAVKKYDSNHLILGVRFAGDGAHEKVWKMCAKYCDVVTLNRYPKVDFERNVLYVPHMKNPPTIVESWTQIYGYVQKPIMVTEWNFPAYDSGLPCDRGDGHRLQTQDQRTAAAELFAKTALSLPFIIGYDFFMWVDDGNNYGLVNYDGKPYEKLTGMFTTFHKEVAKWRRAPTPKEFNTKGTDK